ncbi:hypothetical protein BGZ47_007560 [Haplosporangium gracile]|nr:hypothetical protein BGZ47_007560 [Haplosporangium gracile]
MAWFQKAALGGDVDARRRTVLPGPRRRAGFCQGQGVVLMASHQEHREAQRSVGKMYEYGHGVRKGKVAAKRWFDRAVANNHPEALDTIGKLYYYGNRCSQDYTKALEFYLMAADQGYAEAQFNIGHLYYFCLGAQQDYTKAHE